jgi:hypothetical protein
VENNQKGQGDSQRGLQHLRSPVRTNIAAV